MKHANRQTVIFVLLVMLTFWCALLWAMAK